MEISLPKLAQAVMKSDKVSRAHGYLTAWHILNDYPEELKAAAIAIANGESNPNVTIDSVSYNYAFVITGGAFAALDLLFVLSCDELNGRKISMWLDANDMVQI